MLKGILRAHTEPLRALAAAWLAAGATCYELWSEGERLAQWPEGAITGEPLIEAPIMAGGLVVGTLRVAGATGPDATQRLGAEAALIGSLATIEQELDTMTVELIDMQDQLLALYELTQSTRSHLRIDDTLASLARDSARLARSESACAILAQEQTLLVVQHPPGAVARTCRRNCLGDSRVARACCCWGRATPNCRRGRAICALSRSRFAARRSLP